MILSIRIQHVALIESMFVSLHPGLLVLSGETGAGKSIIIDAVNLILGGRADKNLIRTGFDKASVEAVFETGDCEELDRILEQESIDRDGNTLTVYREIGQNGKNVCRINGIMVSLTLLRSVTSLLVNLHGQSEHQFLADPEKHLGYLDLMGGKEHQELIRKTEEAYQRFMTNHREYVRMHKQNESKDVRMAMLKRELEELQQAGITPGEEKELTNTCIQMEKAARIHGKVSGAYRVFLSDEDGSSAMASLKQAAKALYGLQEEDPSFKDIAEKCDSLYYEMEDIAYQLSRLENQYDFDINKLESAENRLEFIRRIERKYGTTEEDVLRAQHEKEEEYEMLCGLEERVAETGAEHKKLLSAYRQCARNLTESRKRIADEFGKRLIAELKDLGMPHTRFETKFYEDPTGKVKMPTAKGDDQIEFLISPNPGEPLKPLAKIASGGELSRLMLAIKTIESGRSGRETMIFDEIDTGISGQMAQAVAEKMGQISLHQQVICISHLPQIAAAADHQYLVHKSVHEGRTISAIRELDPEERVLEVARMISGAGGLTDEGRRYASEMISASAKRKA